MDISKLNSKQFDPGSPGTEGMIPLCVPEISGNEWSYIKECLDTNWVSSVGPFVDRFERKLEGYVGTKHAVATCNGTAALHIALLVAGVEPDDEVLVSTLTFIASANVIRYVGAWPVFIDAEPDFWQMDPDKVIEFVERKCRYKNGELLNEATGRRVKAILPVHILGHPVDVDPIIEVARKFDLTVIEDATESLGAKYKGNMVGHLGDIACFSFNGNKIITTGGGGMIVTDNRQWAERARYLTTQAKDDAVEFVHREVGYNFRLSNIQAAMGVAQMEMIDKYIEAKRSIAQRYREGLQNIAGIKLPDQAAWAESIFWLYTILIDEQEFGMTSRDVLRTLTGLNIQTRPLWHPLHTLKPFEDCFAYNIEITNRLYRDGLSLPCSVGLTPADQDRVVRSLANIASAIFR
jgi:perosamine synthetase